MNPTIKQFLTGWKDDQSVEATVFDGQVMIAHFDFGIFNRRTSKKQYWEISTLSGEASFFIWDSMDVMIYFDPERRPHVVVSADGSDFKNNPPLARGFKRGEKRHGQS